MTCSLVSHRSSVRILAMVAAIVPTLAFAAVGKVSVLQGTATRTPEGGSSQPLSVGAEIQVLDLVAVGKGSNLKLTLNDNSVLMVSGGSELKVDEATFKDQERTGFSARLIFGKVWSKVSKAMAGSDAKFEVTTDRAVAGVRGTIFRVDATKVIAANTSKPKSLTVVRVEEGKVAVEAEIKKPKPVLPTPKGPRVQVSGPQQISKDEWEKKFTELQANQMVTIGEDSWKEASIDVPAKTDEFAAFIAANQ